MKYTAEMVAAVLGCKSVAHARRVYGPEQARLAAAAVRAQAAGDKRSMQKFLAERAALIEEQRYMDDGCI